MSDTHRLTADAGNNDMPVSSQPELIRKNIPEVSGRHEYICQSSVPDSNYKKIEELCSPLSVVITPNARNLPPYHRKLVIIFAILLFLFRICQTGGLHLCIVLFCLVALSEQKFIGEALASFTEFAYKTAKMGIRKGKEKIGWLFFLSF